MAKQMYEEIGVDSYSKKLIDKIYLMDQKIDEAATQKAKADRYATAADEKYINGDFSTAKVLYLLAKEVYEKEGLQNEVKKIQGRLIVVDKALSPQ